MTDEEKRLQEELLRAINKAHQRQRTQHSREQQKWEEYQRQLQEERDNLARERVQAARRAAERQQAIDEMPRRQYAVIAAIDAHGGFARDRQIPWHYPADLRWFQGRTKGHICVMGRHTYEDIVARNASKEASDTTAVVLSDRQNFVMSRSVDTLPGAIVIKSLMDIENHVDDDEMKKTVFIIGGDRLFREGISMANTVYLTIIDRDFQCDKLFPTDYLHEHFTKTKMYKNAEAEELRFTIWKRKW